MEIALIYATWPNTPNGMAWHKFADAAREAGLTRRLEKAGHEVSEYVFRANGSHPAELRAAFALSRRIAEQVAMSRTSAQFPVVVSGSCTVAALGMLAGLGDTATGIVWMDAHADLNTPDTTLTGLFEGMALAVPLGMCWRTMARSIAGLRPVSIKDVCLYGARDIDADERDLIQAKAVPIVHDATGAASHLVGCERVYVHLDMDVHDPSLLCANAYAVPGGPSPEAVRQDLRTLARRLPVSAFSVTAVDPTLPEAAAAIPCAIDHIIALCEARKSALC